MALYTSNELLKRVNRLDGTPAKIVNDTQDGLLTFNVKEAFRRALNGAYPDEQPSQQNQTGIKFEDKMKRYELSKKIWFSDEAKGVDLSIEEIALVKTCVGKMFNGEALGFLSDVIEKKETPKDADKNS